jgi:hypothetical protein
VVVASAVVVASVVVASVEEVLVEVASAATAEATVVGEDTKNDEDQRKVSGQLHGDRRV